LRNFKKLYKKLAIHELRRERRRKLRTARRAERSRKRRKECAKVRSKFISNPFEFTSKLLGMKTSGKLDCPISEVEASPQ
jgi:hypothetical protein